MKSLFISAAAIALFTGCMGGNIKPQTSALGNPSWDNTLDVLLPDPTDSLARSILMTSGFPKELTIADVVIPEDAKVKSNQPAGNSTLGGLAQIAGGASLLGGLGFGLIDSIMTREVNQLNSTHWVMFLPESEASNPLEASNKMLTALRAQTKLFLKDQGYQLVEDTDLVDKAGGKNLMVVFQDPAREQCPHQCVINFANSKGGKSTYILQQDNPELGLKGLYWTSGWERDTSARSLIIRRWTKEGRSKPERITFDHQFFADWSAYLADQKSYLYIKPNSGYVTEDELGVHKAPFVAANGDVHFFVARESSVKTQGN